MRIVKYSHACVRLELDGAVLVIDPGGWSEAESLDGVDAVLITHEHADHLDAAKLADALAKRPSVHVFTHPEVAPKLDAMREALVPVNSGDSFTAAGFAVTAHGGWHAPIHPELPRVVNLGYLVEQSVYHPGDSFDVPEGASVDTLFVPVSAPWLTVGAAIDFVRAVKPRRAYALHDAIINEKGGALTAGLMKSLSGTAYDRLAPGSSVPD